MNPPATAPELAALAIMASESIGYKAAVKVMAEEGHTITVERLKALKPPRARSRPAVRPAARENRHPTDEAEPDYDPATADPIAHWSREVRYADEMIRTTDDQRGQREWFIQSRAAMAELQKARLATSSEEERIKALEVRDPVELAAKLLEEIPAIARLLPEKAREMYAALGKVLGE